MRTTVSDETSLEQCHSVKYPRISFDENDQLVCRGCGAYGKTEGEPTNGGSYFYYCSRSGASLGYSGV